MAKLKHIKKAVKKLLGDDLVSAELAFGELTCEVKADSIQSVCERLRDDSNTAFSQLIDLCGMDYSEHGQETGTPWQGERFAVIYHLLSLEHNCRIRLRAGVPEAQPMIASVMDVWPVANWFEREAFDLYGILFEGHPDLRRLLTDYGFIGHPFRKDFPVSGHVEMRYDEEKGRVVYQPVTVEPRTLVPRSAR